LEDLTWLNSMLWFLAGAVSYKVITLVLSMSAALTLFNETIYHVLTLLKMGDENYGAQEIIKMWRELSIAMILFACPGKIGQRLGFKNWREAMRLLKKQEVKNEKILS
jgi:hypothetical protein